ncbi:hypothetical protein ACVIGB_006595 [Bradyrhizobium sp. USDA 4341]
MKRNDPQDHALRIRTTGKSHALRIADSVLVMIATFRAAAKLLWRVFRAP